MNEHNCRGQLPIDYGPGGIWECPVCEQRWKTLDGKDWYRSNTAKDQGVVVVKSMVTSYNVSQLPHGLYLIHWKSGGASEASVGSDKAGNRWYAPTNWVGGIPGDDWSLIEFVEKIPCG